jgi:hypothetical protein
MADLNELSAQEIGRRLRLACENAGIRQGEAAKVSEGQLAELLKVRRVELRELLDQIELEESCEATSFTERTEEP